MKKDGNLSIFTKGIIAENPVLRLVLGTCPTLAVTTSALNGIGMGLSATFVLVCSGAVVSLLRNIIPSKVRIPAYITIIAGFVTIDQILVKAFLPDIDAALGIFLPLIVVNCIILARAEMFAAKNPVIPSILDGLGMGIGFTATLTIMGIIRELIGAGSIFSLPVTANIIDPMLVMLLPPGGFFVFGILVAVSNALANKKGKPVVESIGCDGCAQNGSCPFAGDAEKCEKPDAAEIEAAKSEKPDAAEIEAAKSEKPDSAEIEAVNNEKAEDISKDIPKDEKAEAASPAQEGKEEVVNG